ncbi:conserved hypothetical protein [Desulfofarcimen acetoxidans DSM 771]|uniref:Uncharacterized protein n=1 Tax=Desulfofarcimen acetoxidans (strain ATCC 49208 / DSM 771 / KCTC 5769 / VKM B-1644 / 5575) TaxID=485916 RepID=C8VZE0_DESAS|nr:hypothetical protein [Desulfofarcimen acetoxidans]ACV64885.1 conserved hypothetical protein [Desulfofarcimen acetoxidans DSM 771]
MREVDIITKQEWQEVEEQLQSFYTTVKLKCDEYNISLRLERLNQFKNVISVYVNGVVKGTWLMEDCEERKRFMRPVKKSLYSQKRKEEMKKFSKKKLKEYGIDLEATYTCYLPFWKSFKKMRSHLTKNNKTIELVKDDSRVDV